MRLSNFAHYVSCIMADQAPTRFTLPVGDNRAEVIITPAVNLPGPIWDRVTINGVDCGNRHGAVSHYTKMVIDAKVTIEMKHP